MSDGSRYEQVETPQPPPSYLFEITSRGEWELLDVSGIDHSAVGRQAVPNDLDWQAYAIALLFTHTTTLKNLTSLHKLLQEKGYHGGRTALYGLPKLLVAAEAAGIYTSNKKTREARKGVRTADGSIEAVDAHE